jgi:hypothetical protein
MVSLPKLDEFGEYAIGAVAGFLFNHVAAYIPSPPNYAIVARDAKGTYIWGFSVNNALTLGAGTGLYAVGKYKHKDTVKNLGKG